MESAAALPTIPLLALSRTLKASAESDPRCNYGRFYCHLRRCLAGHTHPLKQPLRSGCSSPVAKCFGSFDRQRPAEWLLFSSVGTPLRGSPTVASPWRLPLASISSASADPAGAGGGGDSLGAGSGGGGGDGGSSGGGMEEKSLTGRTEDVAKLGADVIILDVGGMSCGGCVASVKRILESLPQVSSASVNLTTETAVVWATSEAKATPNWQQEVGQKLANHLTTCGFKSNLRDSSRENFYRIFEKKMDEKLLRLKENGRELVASWALCAVCLLGHISHFFHANAPSWIHALHSTGFHLALSLFTLIGPGRQLILDGLRSFYKGSPNMNTLVGLGALSSFAVSSVAALVPKLTC